MKLKAKNDLLRLAFPKSSFSKQEEQEIRDSFELVSFKTKETLHYAERILNEYYFLDQGFIRSHTINSEGKEVTTQFFQEGDIVIDWASFMLQQTSAESFEALAPTLCWKISRAQFEHLFNTIEAFRTAGRNRISTCFFKLHQHHLNSITENASERYVRLLQDFPTLIQHASLKQIASYLGVTDSSLSRIRHGLVRS
jgi:CRP-like cAMP-binding protein